MENFKLEEKFFQREKTLEIAQELLGKILIRKENDHLRAGIIVEVEAYHGYEDKASHASKSKTERNKIMFENGGAYYVYMIYGMYWNLNIVTGKNGFPSAILIRALEPIFDSKDDLNKLTLKDKKRLSSGPGKICRWMNIDKRFYGKRVNDEELFLLDINNVKNIIPEININNYSNEIVRSKRVGVDYAEESADLDWRFYLKDNKYISRI